MAKSQEAGVASRRYPHNAAAMARMENAVPTPTQEEMDEFVVNRSRTNLTPRARRAAAKPLRRKK